MEQENGRLFAEFPPVTTAEWEEILFQDLKGADYQKKLVWKTLEGFEVKPYYRFEDIKDLPHMKANPASHPYVRGHKKDNNKWEVRTDINETDPVKANHAALKLIAFGAIGLGFRGKEIIMKEQMAQLLQDINLKNTAIHFTSVNCLKDTGELFTGQLHKAEADMSSVRGSFNFDPLGYFLLHHKFYGHLEQIFKEAVPFLKDFSSVIPSFHKITVNGHYYHNAGASIVQEIAFTLAHANEYISILTDEGFSMDQLSKMMRFSMAAGSDFFMEIAKLRALRMLWANVAGQYKPENEDAMTMFIHASTSLRDKTIYDAHVNLLRNTTETMSAIIGCVDSVNVLPYDVVFSSGDEFSRRIAQNIQIVLREESYLDKLVDPAAGSYYIEYLTDAIAKEAWALFQRVEENGGFIEAVKSGFIREEIMKVRKQRDLDIAMRRQTVLGTNQHPDLKETAIDKVPELRTEEMDDNVQGLEIYRGAEIFEEIRLETELYKLKKGITPAVFLFPAGNPNMSKARAGFITNFFGCAGYNIMGNDLFRDISEGVLKALNSKAGLVVICSSDEDYPLLAPEIAKKIKAGNAAVRVIIAGNPQENIEMLRNAGVDDFVHIRTNVVETLQKYNRLLLK